MPKRVFYIIAIALLIVLGLSSRKVAFLPDETGDGLWAMALFCFLRLIFVNSKLKDIAIITLVLSFLVEFSQLIRWEWLVAFRSTAGCNPLYLYRAHDSRTRLRMVGFTCLLNRRNRDVSRSTSLREQIAPYLIQPSMR